MEEPKEANKQESQAQPISIFIGIPAYDKKLYVSCVQAVMNAMQVLLVNQIKFDFVFEVGMPWLSAVRNALARKFMESEHTDMVFIDSDLGFPPEAFVNLISSPEELIAGAYPKKQHEPEFAVKLATGKDGRPVVENGALEGIGLPTGFMKIKRSVFEKLAEAHPELAYEDPIYHKKTFNFFGTGVRDGQWVGDDYGFCDLWRGIGGKCWVLPDVTFTHSGPMAFEGNLHNHLMQPAQGGPKWTSKTSSQK